MELTAGLSVGHAPAVLTEIPQTGYVATEERSELPAAVFAVALVTQLVVQDVGLHLNLEGYILVLYIL